MSTIQLWWLIFLKRRSILPAVLRSVFHKEETIKARVQIQRLKEIENIPYDKDDNYNMQFFFFIILLGLLLIFQGVYFHR